MNPPSPLSGRQKTQIALITAAALALFVVVRLLPTGTNLSHMDFRVTGGNSIEFCDPLNPQFIPVVSVRSPVTMTLQPSARRAGSEARLALTLRTSSGKPLAPEDLLVVHTKRLHLLIIDPTLADYQHIHPEPGRKPGEWHFSFTPRLAGDYRVFADFTPAATGRGLYAGADLDVGPALAAGPSPRPGERPADQRQPYSFSLTPAGSPIRARQPVDLTFAVARPDGGAVPLEPVMGAYAHLVAFDEMRSGFAHLHPVQTDLTLRPDSVHPLLNFKVTIPTPGRYVIWAQINLAGTEIFAPFWFVVEP